MSWIKDIFSPKQRSWENFYRNRWACDKVVRSTHGVNCTGSCSWNVHVKQDIVTWEMQALDYPRIDKNIPPYEPRGCQRGISYSWYLYSPLRVKYPYVRGALLDLWHEAKSKHPDDTVAAWRSIVTNPKSRSRFQKARGKGGFRRVSWDEVLEIIAASNIHTVLRHGPDRIVGFSPIPAMSMVSYAAGARFMQLMGGVSLSFYDWYCDLPPASPEMWGEQTDVAESADWYHSKMIAVVGSNVLMTRTPDAHFLVEARHGGSKVVVFSPDFSQVSKVADEWIPLHQGQDGAFWLSVAHVILKEFYIERQVPYFINYMKKYSDAPFVVVLEKDAQGQYKPGRLLRASEVEQTRDVENAEWKLFVFDELSGELRMPKGSVGHRWQSQKGEWNLNLNDSLTNEAIDPTLLLLDKKDQNLPVTFTDFSADSNGKKVTRHVPVREVKTTSGVEHLRLACRLLEKDCPSASEALSLFLKNVQKESLKDLKEIYTRTFYVFPQCIPYVSVHLFGEESFKRAEIMAGLQEVYQKKKFDSGKELPDHLAVILRFAPHFSSEEWQDMVHFCLKKSVETMVQNLKKAKNMYRFVLQAIRSVLEMEYSKEVIHV